MLTEQIVNGIILGSMYALIAQGYTLIFGVLDKLNFAHSEIFMLGGFLFLTSLVLGAPLVAAALFAILIAGVLGLAVELVAFRKFTSAAGHITAALSSFAAGLVIVDLSHKVWGTQPLPLPLPDWLVSGSVEVFGIKFIVARFVILVVALLVMAVLHYVVMHSKLGRQIRAVAESPTHAMLLGINVKRVTQIVFFIASAMAGLAGVAMAVRTSYASSDTGFTFGIKALAIMAIGGMGDLRGALLGGILVGVLEALSFNYGLGRMADMFVWLFMIMVLLVRPSGLFGSAIHREARA
jgi:branched-chain amino acid transport system permease protein